MAMSHASPIYVAQPYPYPCITNLRAQAVQSRTILQMFPAPPMVFIYANI